MNESDCEIHTAVSKCMVLDPAPTGTCLMHLGYPE